MAEELERATLAECEAVIERGLQTFYEVGMALLKIRNDELYHPEHETFTDYCLSRWGWRIHYIRRCLRAAEVLRNFDETMVSSVEGERQLRPLGRLEPEQQREAWKIAVEQSETGRPTGREVEAIVRARFLPPSEPSEAQIEAEQRARDAEDRAVQLERERQEADRQRREAELQRREAEQRAEELLRERDEIQINRYMRFRKMIEAVQYVAEFHMESIPDTWDGITNARGGEDFMENLEKAQRCLTRLRTEHPNAVRKPGIVLKRPG